MPANNSISCAVTAVSIFGIISVFYATMHPINRLRLIDTNCDGQQLRSSKVNTDRQIVELANGHTFDWRLFDEINASLAEIGQNAGARMGNIAQRNKQVLFWANLSAQLRPDAILNQPPTICEVGVAFGYAAIIFLHSNPSVRYIGFDLGLSYLRESSEHLMNAAQFRNYTGNGRMTIIWGYSGNILRAFRDDSRKCNVLIIDAAHDYKAVEIDFENGRHVMDYSSPQSHIVVMDDCEPTGGPFAVLVDKGIRVKGTVDNVTFYEPERDALNRPITWCSYQYVKQQ